MAVLYPVSKANIRCWKRPFSFLKSIVSATYSSFRAFTLNGDDLQEPEPARHEFQILEWVAEQMYKTVLSSRPETNYFANQHTRKMEGNNTFVLHGFSKTRCTLEKLPWQAMSHWKVWEGKESPQSHHNYDTKPHSGDPGMPAGTSLTKITSELSMFNWQPRGVTGQMSPSGTSCTSTTSLCPQRCAWRLRAQHPAAQGCPQHKPSACAADTGFGKHTRLVFRN